MIQKSNASFQWNTITAAASYGIIEIVKTTQHLASGGKEVEKLVHPFLKEMPNDEGKTAQDMFTEEHKFFGPNNVQQFA